MPLIAMCLVFVLINLSNCERENVKNPPHIIFIVADDLGWNDVSFHGSPEIPTPNIDAMGLSGISFHSHYSEWLCTPSRGALMTGMYPIRLGLQHRVIVVGERSALPLNITILPQHLQRLGYETHMVGKWHLGFYTKNHMPTNRGFQTFVGYMNGAMDYYDYTNFNDGYPKPDPSAPDFYGIDLYEGTQPIRDFRGHYATHFFAKTASDRILNHNTSKPLFLYVPEIAVHTGGGPQSLQAPPEAVKKFKYIKDNKRRIYAGVTSVLDDAVGMIFEALHQKDMLNNSIVVFISDNGGEVDKSIGGYGTNFPLRGHKATLWEGGIRVPAIIWSPMFKLKEPKILNHLMHISDWLPTLYRAAGGDPIELGSIDGYDMWKVITEDSPSLRYDILHNLDTVAGVSSYRWGDLKVVNGTNDGKFNFWFGPTGFEHGSPLSMERWVFKNGSTVRNILEKTGLWIAENPDDWYRQSRVVCHEPSPETALKCNPEIKPCLFDIRTDPCEYTDLADEYPEIVKDMMNKIYFYERCVAVAPQSKEPDPLANPACHNFTFVPWMDPEYYHVCDHLS